ncbi:MAG: VOC family protein, partial [Burkholderiales bacterium]|nr:VOC family protein [Burkholderiales bacterium]
MALTLNHYSIRTADLDAVRHFYADVLGLSVGPRPDFPFPGLWMYRGDHADPANAVVHVIGIDRADPQG